MRVIYLGASMHEAHDRLNGGSMRTVPWLGRWRRQGEALAGRPELGPPSPEPAASHQVVGTGSLHSFGDAVETHELRGRQLDEVAEAHRQDTIEPEAPIGGTTAPKIASPVALLFMEPRPATNDGVVSARLLGPFEVGARGESVSWHSQRAASVLKYLLLYCGDGIPREVLMAAFWPSSTPGSARNNLNVAIYAARRALNAIDPEHRHVIYRNGTYLFNPQVPHWVDVHEHELACHVGHRCYRSSDAVAALQAYGYARRLYRGPLMAGDTSGEWFIDRQARLCDEHHLVLERLGELHLQQGNISGSIDVGRELVAADPCRESGHQILMRGYAALGQSHLVIRQYRQCVDLLRRELSVEPNGATRTLLQSLTASQRQV
jgi:DNA-binding SARP family transcriptional activator